mgnify:CR=1 FL=1
MTLISFIAPSYNRRPQLDSVLNEIGMRGYDFDYEIIIIDNKSEDGSIEMVREKYPHVRLISLDENIGAKSRNIGIKEALGRYIVMIDDDSYPLPGAVEQAVEVFKKDRDEKIGAIAFNILQGDGSYWTAGIHTAFTGCGAMFRKSLFDRIGHYPEDYIFYTEEYDVSCRIWGGGMKVLTFQELKFLHYKSSRKRDFNRIMNRLVRNNIVLWRRYLPVDLAERQLEMEVWRYRRIALKEGVMDGFESGLDEGHADTLPYMNGGSSEALGHDAALAMLGYPAIVDKVGRIADEWPGASVLVFNIGKCTHLLLDVIHLKGLKVAGIIDDNAHMQGDTVGEIRVHGREALDELDYDCILIGSMSICLNDEIMADLPSEVPDKPVIRMVDYDRLSDYT